MLNTDSDWLPRQWLSNSPLWKQWGGAEIFREKGNANPLFIFIAFAVWSICGHFWSLTNHLKLYLFRDNLGMAKKGGVGLNLWSVLVAFSGQDL